MTACSGYPRLAELMKVVRDGVRVPLLHEVKRSSRPLENHLSAQERLLVLRKNVRQEQDAGRCIVLDLDMLDLWPEVVVSPFGGVDKAGSDPATTSRTIHNLYFPLAAQLTTPRKNRPSLSRITAR
jgi:hypothetical protein